MYEENPDGCWDSFCYIEENIDEIKAYLYRKILTRNKEIR